MKLGELLITNGLITRAQLEQALATQSTYGGKLGTNLVELGYITDLALAQFLSKQMNIAAATPKDFDSIPKDVVGIISKDFASKYQLIPLSLNTKLTVAISDPNDLVGLDELSFKTGKRVQPCIAPEIWITAALERYYKVPRKERFIDLKKDESTFASWSGSMPLQSMPNVGAEIDLEAISQGEHGISLDVYIGRLLKTVTKDDVFTALMDFVAPHFSRMAIYIIRKEEIIGWMLRGFPVHGAEFQKVHVSKSADTMIRRVMEDQNPYVGPSPSRGDDFELVKVLNIRAGTEIRLYPMTFRGKGIAVLMGCMDPTTPKNDEKIHEIVLLAVTKASLGLELGAVRKALTDIPNL